MAITLFAALAWIVSADKRGKWLREAAWTDHTVRAKLLVWLGTDVNYATGSGSALHGAAYKGNIELMSFLIRHGAVVDQPAKYGVTALWWARKNKQSEAEKLLLAHGANPDTSHIHPP